MQNYSTQPSWTDRQSLSQEDLSVPCNTAHLVSLNAWTLRGYEIKHTTKSPCANRTQHMWRVQRKLQSALLQTAS